MVFAFFVVKSPFAGPGEDKGIVYHEDREDTKKGKGFEVWLGGNGGDTQPLNLRVFVFFVVKSPFARPDEGKGVVYHEGHEGHEEGHGV